jgi:PTH1 family peptidyl-tRNA hydrolase
MEEPPMRFRRRLFSSYLFCQVTGKDGSRPLVLLRYLGYMNNSGEFLTSRPMRLNASPGNLLVILDNMDLDPGICRLRTGGGDAGHNGLKSLIRHLGSGAFHRLYIGVGRPSPGTGVVEHVLGNPEGAEETAIENACSRAAEAIRNLALMPMERVMEELNRRNGNDR